MDDLVQFLRDRYDEEAGDAEAAGDSWYSYEPDQQIAFVSVADAHHIARHSPARVLREIEAKRRILEEHQPDRFGGCATCARPEDFDDDAEGNRTFSRSAKLWPCPTVRLLALPYADYKEKWKP